MIVAPYIHHVTLNTGHTRVSPREEVSDDALVVVARLLAGGRIPAVEPPCTLEVTTRASCILATVISASCGPLATIGVADVSRDVADVADVDKPGDRGEDLWRSLHDARTDLATNPDECPPEPWCGARLEVGIALYPEAAHWLGDFERCLAWAWVLRDEATS